MALIEVFIEEGVERQSYTVLHVRDYHDVR